MIRDWFPRFMVEHSARHPHMRIPGPEDPAARVLYRAWLEAFQRAGIADYHIATTASVRLAARPETQARFHLSVLLAYAKEQLPPPVQPPVRERVEPTRAELREWIRRNDRILAPIARKRLKDLGESV